MKILVYSSDLDVLLTPKQFREEVGDRHIPRLILAEEVEKYIQSLLIYKYIKDDLRVVIDVHTYGGGYDVFLQIENRFASTVITDGEINGEFDYLNGGLIEK